MSSTCPDNKLKGALERMDLPNAQQHFEKLIADYPEDARLHLLLGSVLAAARDYEGAKAAMAQAVELSPDYGIARFQLGFLHFTSGDAAEAVSIWEPLREHSPDDYLRLFAEGLERLAVDDFDQAEELIRRGIAANRANPPLNGDMRLLLEAMAGADKRAGGEDEPLSATQLALRQSAARNKLN